MSLAKIYVDATLHKVFPDATTHQGLWNDWLWGVDCNGAMEEEYGDMNAMHILGILLSVLESTSPSSDPKVTVQAMVKDIPLVHLYSKPIADFSLRELTNQLECMQLSWGQILSHGDFDTYCSLLKALFARFGYIIHRAYPNVDNSVLDDPQYMTQIPSDNEESVFFITTRKFIRQMVSIFLALFRAIFIISSAEIAPVVSEEMHAMIKAAFKNHHVESSLDFFNHLQQVICLAPGMRLVYRTNFAGMYNDISQVVYFHHPKFSKQPQLKMQEILLSSLNALPLVTQLFPQVQVFYDDDSVIPFLTNPKRGFFHAQTHARESQTASHANIDEFVQNKMEEKAHTMSGKKHKAEEKKEDSDRYAWLVCCSSVFLIDIAREKIFGSYDQSILPLIACMAMDHKATIGKSLQEQFQDPQTFFSNKSLKMDLATAHGHVFLV